MKCNELKFVKVLNCKNTHTKDLINYTTNVSFGTIWRQSDYNFNF